MRRVKLNDIRIDGGTQSRVVIDQAMVYQYIECMKEGDVFPFLDTVFDGATHWLVDGFHRYHAYKLMGIKELAVNYTPGTQAEAQILSFGVNGKHGKPRTADDKRNAVQMALEHPELKDKTTYEIAKICAVSQPFVAGIRDPKVKEKHKAAAEKHVQKKAEELNDVQPDTNSISSEKTTVDSGAHVDTGFAPSDDELRANELAQQADLELLNKMLESDEPLKLAHEEIKRLNFLNAQMEIRIASLMTEKNEAIKDAKRAQSQLDKIKKAQK